MNREDKKEKRERGRQGDGESKGEEEGEGEEEEGVRYSRHGKAWSRVRCVVSIISCFLLTSTGGFAYAFGNITPYVTSYLRNVTGDANVDFTDTFWISQATNITAYVCMPFLGLLANRISVKLYLLIGILFSAGSLFGSYWALQASLSWTVLTYGVLLGIPCSIFYPTSVRVAVEWLPNRAGFISGVILMGYGVGSFIWTAIITWYINPNNLEPDVKIGEDVYFTQAAVLDRVPPCFLMLGIVLVSTQLLATLFVCRPTPSHAKARVVNESDGLIPSDSQDSDVPAARCKQKNYRTVADREGRSNPPEKPNFSPKEVLKSRVFWTLWLMMIFSQLCTSFFTTLYKAYGQTFIHDDHFLALVASISSIANAVGRPFWGLLADRIGYRIAALVAQCILACLVVTLVTCEETGRVTFFLWVCAMFLTMCGFLTMLPVLVMAVFGSHHFNVNFGLIQTNEIVGSVILGLIAPVVKDAFGWHGLFYVGFGGLFASILLNMSISLQCGNTIPPQMFSGLSLQR